VVNPGAVAATTLYFTGGLAAIPFVAPFVAQLGNLIIAPLTPIAAGLLATTWYATKFVVNKAIKPLFRCMVNCIAHLCCAGSVEADEQDHDRLLLVSVPLFSVAQTNKTLAEQQPSSLISGGSDNVHDQDVKGGVEIDFGSSSALSSLGQFGSSGSQYQKITTEEENLGSRVDHVSSGPG
jgi:hypothetical protein